ASAVSSSALGQFVVIFAPLAIKLRCELDFKAAEFNGFRVHKFWQQRGESNSHLSLEGAASWHGTTLPHSGASQEASPAFRKPMPLAEMHHKNQKPPICTGGREPTRSGCPGYMNVPFPPTCHLSMAAVRKESVWGMRIMISMLTLNCGIIRR